MNILDLDLEDFRLGRGRAVAPIDYEVVREITPEDLPLLNTERGVKPQALTRIRQRHHALARALASGMKHSEAAAVCGYDISRVSILLGDPAFQELMEFYKGDLDKVYGSYHERLAGLGEEAVEEMRRRFEEEPEKIPSKDVLKAIELVADRTGHGPSSSNTQVNVNINMADRLQNARKRVEAAQLASGLVIDLEPNE